MRQRPTVGLGALWLDPGVSGGSETYLRELVPRLVARRPDLAFELVTTRRGARALVGEGWGGLLPVLEMPCDDDAMLRRTLVEQGGVLRTAARRGWALLHSLSNRGPATGAVPSVVTVHDVIPFEHATLGQLSTLGTKAAVGAAARHADRVLTVSEAARSSIAAVLGVPLERITAVPHGAGRPVAAAPADRAVLRAEHGLEGRRVVLCVAAKRPHKNQELLVRALPGLPPDVVLVLAGHDEGYGAALEATADGLGVRDRVRLVPYVPDPELEGLWALADCAAFPTRAEGFGLPVLEAMLRGVPVACSDLPVLREVAGDAAVLFAPDDARAAARAVGRALVDPALPARGRARAALFTWDEAARRTAAVYDEVL